MVLILAQCYHNTLLCTYLKLVAIFQYPSLENCAQTNNVEVYAKLYKCSAGESAQTLLPTSKANTT